MSLPKAPCCVTRCPGRLVQHVFSHCAPAEVMNSPPPSQGKQQSGRPASSVLPSYLRSLAETSVSLARLSVVEVMPLTAAHAASQESQLYMQSGDRSHSPQCVAVLCVYRCSRSLHLLYLRSAPKHQLQHPFTHQSLPPSPLALTILKALEHSRDAAGGRACCWRRNIAWGQHAAEQQRHSACT